MWNRQYIDHVQITMAEDFGVEGRGGFYDAVGALRDVVQNHVLQLLTLVAMEPPVSNDADALRDERSKVLRAMPPLEPARVVRGQVAGYRDEPGGADDSEVETFVALRAPIDSWRWAGVPFYIRAGKDLPVTATEVMVEFIRPPRLYFERNDAPAPHPNQLVFQVLTSATSSLPRLRRDEGGAVVLSIAWPLVPSSGFGRTKPPREATASTDSSATPSWRRGDDRRPFH